MVDILLLRYYMLDFQVIDNYRLSLSIDKYCTDNYDKVGGCCLKKFLKHQTFYRTFSIG